MKISTDVFAKTLFSPFVGHTDFISKAGAISLDDDCLILLRMLPDSADVSVNEVWRTVHLDSSR